MLSWKRVVSEQLQKDISELYECFTRLRDQLNAEDEAIQIFSTGIDTISTPPSQQSTKNRGKAIVTSFAPTYDPEPARLWKDDEVSKEKEIDKLMDLISLSFKKIYKHTNNNPSKFTNTSRANQDNSPRITEELGYDNQRAVINDIYLMEQGDTNITIDLSDICYDRAQDDQDETDDLDQERDLLDSLI
ncbi:hypothetical protein Tco_0005435 [Tanacetum coccineum]